MERNGFLKAMIAYALVCCVCLSGCGKETPETESKTETESKSSETVESGEDSTQSVQLPAGEEYFRTPIPDQVIPEDREVITLGTFGEVMVGRAMYKAANAFNQAQEKYFIYIEEYSSYNNFLMDIARKQGTDLYSFSLYGSVSTQALVNNGVIENLTPYFEASGTIGREDIVDSVWRAGSVDDELYFLIPSFRCRGILVEKGNTKEGAWSGKDYLELGKKNPGSILEDRIQQNPGNLLVDELQWYLSAFINWEDLTCSFDSDEFIALLEDLKTLGDYKYEDVDENAPLAELIRRKVYLAESVTINLDYGLRSYRDITEAFGDGYEVAGMPSADGSLQYGMSYDEIYCMNAASGNKEGAWAFLEYLLSEEYQQPDPPIYVYGEDGTTMLNGSFPVRKDMLEQGLQANIDYVEDPDRVIYRINKYIGDGENIKGGYAGSTQEDKQAILHIIENAYRPAFDIGDRTILFILQEETAPFFLGQKTAREVAEIIQSRLSLYLAEF